jgi:hypothetical protein
MRLNLLSRPFAVPRLPTNQRTHSFTHSLIHLFATHYATHHATPRVCAHLPAAYSPLPLLALPGPALPCLAAAAVSRAAGGLCPALLRYELDDLHVAPANAPRGGHGRRLRRDAGAATRLLLTITNK